MRDEKCWLPLQAKRSLTAVIQFGGILIQVRIEGSIYFEPNGRMGTRTHDAVLCFVEPMSDIARQIKTCFQPELVRAMREVNQISIKKS